MSGLLRFGLFAAGAFALVGCGSGDAADPNYEQKVTLSADDKARAEQNMAGQAAPGSAPGSTSPAAMAMPAGKGK